MEPENPEREIKETPKAVKKVRWQKRLQRRLILTLAPPLVAKWMRWFDYTACKDNEKLLVIMDWEEMGRRVTGQKDPSILAVWHNRLIFGPTAYSYLKGKGLAVMVSRSFDGELIAATVKHFKGFIPVRGGSHSKPGQDKGGQEALAEMIEYGRQGYDLCITPDGPQGPMYQAKRGVVDLAMATGFPVFTAGCNCSKYIETKSWDKTRMPYPYAHFIYRVGGPIWVPKDADENLQEAKRLEIETSLRELTEFADHYYDHGIPKS